MKADSHSKRVKKGLLRHGWTRLTALLVSAALVATLIVSFVVFFKLIGRRPEDPLVRMKRHDEAHEILFDSGHNGYRVIFPTSDGLKLTGVVVERPNAHGTILFCHGFWRDKESMVRFIDLFPHYHLMLFDFRACGESEGDYTSIGCHEYQDVMSAMRFIKNHPVLGATRPHIVFGASMGAAAAIKAASEQPDIADALILDSPYACLTEEVEHVFGKMSGLPHYPFFPLMFSMFRWFWGLDEWLLKPELAMEKIKLPMLLIHSSTDFFTQPHHSIRLYAKASAHNKRARLWVGPPAKHTDLYTRYPEYYRHKIGKFLRKLAGWLRNTISIGR
ncbi:MAG: alpha/beta fold hydrolase [Candidatus Dependentiae bacterium]|jgi:pimeloyl-ACP methyl ester carboxylesterase